MKIREKGGLRTVYGFRADSVTGTNFVVCSHIRVLVTEREVNMARYWPSSFFSAFINLEEVEIHKKLKNEKKTKNLLYGIKHQQIIFVLV